MWLLLSGCSLCFERVRLLSFSGTDLAEPHHFLNLRRRYLVNHGFPRRLAPRPLRLFTVPVLRFQSRHNSTTFHAGFFVQFRDIHWRACRWIGERAALLYCIVYVLCCATKHFNNVYMLILGRVLGGISTSSSSLCLSLGWCMNTAR